MKLIKTIVTCILCMIITVLYSCKDTDYRKACEEHDFQKAYKIVNLLEDETDKKQAEYEGEPSNIPIWGMKNTKKGKKYTEYKNAKSISDEAKRYVVLQEAMFVLESEGTNGLIRIIGIGKEHNAELWLYPELLDVAKKIGDTNLANEIETIIQSNH